MNNNLYNLCEMVFKLNVIINSMSRVSFTFLNLQSKSSIEKKNIKYYYLEY